MFQAKTYDKMQIGLGVMLVAAVLLTLAAAVWPLASVQADGGEGRRPRPFRHMQDVGLTGWIRAIAAIRGGLGSKIGRSNG